MNLLVPLWCGVWGVVALAGFGMSVAGVTREQRTVRLVGRIVRVRVPVHGGSRAGGVSVVVSYRDPVSGREVTVTNDGERGDTVAVAWVGREIGVAHLRGRPHAYRFTGVPLEPGRGLFLPGVAVFLVYAGLVVLAAVEWGWPWALVGLGGPWAVFGTAHLPGAVRAKDRRVERLAAMDTVPGRVVAVLKDVTVDQDDGHTATTLTPVIEFTTREGTAVTAYCTTHLPDPAHAHGRDLTVHYTPTDPADFTLNPTADQHAAQREMIFDLTVSATLVTALITGVTLLL
ncbi:DUF3592 domain-containing protein [Streptomyces paludis]|uniref:DUF3592 domain-containing protein n=1 Tax=Streptomyces paludis TaxID=2282738 RepID=A0A345HZ37_9ACTN|nr:DUF3592 domain-containing protein [Streptomyces paludis]AXG81961.1 DUF3592 domain-containing protein [Streptomyces paludis]